MYLSQVTIQNFRQFGAGEAELSIVLQPGVTALVGRVYHFYYHRIQEVFKQDALMHK